MNMLVFILQSIAWPAAVSFCVWRITATATEHSKRMAAELADANYLETKAAAAKAAREIEEARAAWEAAALTTTEELSQIKGALINRGTI